MCVTEPGPFQIAIPGDVLDDLYRRLAAARLPPRRSVSDGEPGDPAGEDEEVIERIAGLVAYWRDGYDWRAQERRMNAVPQCRAEVDGVGLHVLHVPGAGLDPMPLLLCNGWPSSMVEYLPVLSMLTDPAAHGADPADSFTVVVPALPGFGFSDQCLDRRPTRRWIADLFHLLMAEQLGYERYVAHGDDIGGKVISWLGVRNPPGLLAMQTASPMPPYLGPADTLTAPERSFVAASQRWDRDVGAYDHVQATRPRTLSLALNDSPAGLAAWILEKWLTWSDPATRDRLSPDELLTNVMIYWLTETIGSSMRFYVPATEPPLRPGEAITAPASVLIPHEHLPVPPESWLRRAYPGMERFVVLDRGGHFLASEDPHRFVAEIRETFRPHRRRQLHRRFGREAARCRQSWPPALPHPGTAGEPRAQGRPQGAAHCRESVLTAGYLTPMMCAETWRRPELWTCPAS
jgi:pimeloyl-ACP methyl ester carboxylesterase